MFTSELKKRKKKKKDKAEPKKIKAEPNLLTANEDNRVSYKHTSCFRLQVALAVVV